MLGRIIGRLMLARSLLHNRLLRFGIDAVQNQISWEIATIASPPS